MQLMIQNAVFNENLHNTKRKQIPHFMEKIVISPHCNNQKKKKKSKL